MHDDEAAGTRCPEVHKLFRVRGKDYGRSGFRKEQKIFLGLTKTAIWH